jgi:hypothetical protein
MEQTLLQMSLLATHLPLLTAPPSPNLHCSSRKWKALLLPWYSLCSNITCTLYFTSENCLKLLWIHTKGLQIFQQEKWHHLINISKTMYLQSLCLCGKQFESLLGHCISSGLQPETGHSCLLVNPHLYNIHDHLLHLIWHFIASAIETALLNNLQIYQSSPSMLTELIGIECCPSISRLQHIEC